MGYSRLRAEKWWVEIEVLEAFKAHIDVGLSMGEAFQTHPNSVSAFFILLLRMLTYTSLSVSLIRS